MTELKRPFIEDTDEDYQVTVLAVIIVLDDLVISLDVFSCPDAVEPEDALPAVEDGSKCQAHVKAVEHAPEDNKLNEINATGQLAIHPSKESVVVLH